MVKFIAQGCNSVMLFSQLPEERCHSSNFMSGSWFYDDDNSPYLCEYSRKPGIFLTSIIDHVFPHESSSIIGNERNKYEHTYKD